MDASSYQWIVSSSPCGICVTDSDGRILHANPAFERLLGWPLDELRGQPLADCLEREIADSAQRLRWRVALSEALLHGRTTDVGPATEVQDRSADAQAATVSGVVSPWWDDTSRRRGALIVLHGNELPSDQRQSRARFLAALAHELGLPLANLAAATELLGRRLDADDVDRRRLLEIIRAEIARLERLIEQGLSPLQQGGKVSPAQVGLLALPPLLSRVVQIYEIHGGGHRFAVSTPEDLPLVRSDTDRIQQILSNLVHNAVRYAPRDSQITLLAEEHPDRVLIRVCDRGPGVPPEDRPHLFEPFFRGGYAKQSTEGQGLGLSIARSLARQLGGDLWYDEQAAEGACFCLALPRG
jgi:PAS domain S-box-containing protein